MLRSTTCFVQALLFAVGMTAIPAVANDTSAFAGALTLPIAATPPDLRNGLKDPAWQRGVRIPISYDLRTHSTSARPAVAYALIANGNLYVAFSVDQENPVVADHQQDDAGLGTDDSVLVYLYPDGANGFAYSFASNPRGIHAASSSENTAYAPAWQSFGRTDAHGYVVTMCIPLSVMKSGANGTWRANFRRTESKTLEDDLWSYGPSATAGSDPPISVAGRLDGFPAHNTLAYPKTRVGVYGLGELASSTIEGSTSRVGADVSIPVTRTTSFVATLHPDYSNVEVDQQTIAPTAFPRYFDEVRPFFTQLNNSYNVVSSVAAVTVQPLYSYLIPTPRYGTAVEGKQGPFSFAAFDAVGDARDDNGQSISFQSGDQRTTLSAQRQLTSIPALSDEVETYGGNYDSQKGLSFNLVSAREANPFVTTASQARWLSAGMSLYDHLQSLSLAWEKIGARFNPVDAYVQNNDVAGWSGAYFKTWYRAKDAKVPRVLVYAESDLYRNHLGDLAQRDNELAVGADISKVFGLPELAHVRGQIGSSYFLMPDGQLVPVTQNSVDFTYGYRTATPLFVSYATGRFGPGTLDYWTRQLAVRVAGKVIASFEGDDGDQRLDDGFRNKQWLLKESLVWQQSPGRSLSFGVRHIVGASPTLEVPIPFVPTPVNQWNLSAAFYSRWPHAELYAAYGDPSKLTTVPGFLVKFVRYLGAEKGV